MSKSASRSPLLRTGTQSHTNSETFILPHKRKATYTDPYYQSIIVRNYDYQIERNLEVSQNCLLSSEFWI